jgi:hypothetical protein
LAHTWVQRILAAGLLCLVAGCGSLPTIAQDLARRPGLAVQLQGAHGPLPPTQSKAILDRLSSRGEETGIFERHLAREVVIVGSPLTVGNRVRLLQDGPATYRAMLEAILAAHDHINMQTYVLADDQGQRFARALIDKQRQGVQVNLIHDRLGTIGTPASFFQRLSAGDVMLLESNPMNPVLARKDWALINATTASCWSWTSARPSWGAPTIQYRHPFQYPLIRSNTAPPGSSATNSLSQVPHGMTRGRWYAGGMGGLQRGFLPVSIILASRLALFSSNSAFSRA